MRINYLSAAIACVLTALVAGCATSPADYATTLSSNDPKWRSPQCQQMRAAAARYEAGQPKTISVATGLLLGPYGLGIALAGKEHQERQRRLFARDMHMQCSSRPLPKELLIAPSIQHDTMDR